mmetsp:Transcript_55477/g.157980  ORF Transcript_55477/g.157980 Transcript_55477/m.157980 type:complete len:275 (-) Transcript_55477:284-1108(-)
MHISTVVAASPTTSGLTRRSWCVVTGSRAWCNASPQAQEALGLAEVDQMPHHALVPRAFVLLDVWARRRAICTEHSVHFSCRGGPAQDQRAANQAGWRGEERLGPQARALQAENALEAAVGDGRHRNGHVQTTLPDHPGRLAALIRQQEHERGLAVGHLRREHHRAVGDGRARLLRLCFRHVRTETLATEPLMASTASAIPHRPPARRAVVPRSRRPPIMAPWDFFVDTCHRLCHATIEPHDIECSSRLGSASVIVATSMQNDDIIWSGVVHYE